MKHSSFFISIICAFLFFGCQNTPDTATAEKKVQDLNKKFLQQPYFAAKRVRRLCFYQRRRPF